MHAPIPRQHDEPAGPVARGGVRTLPGYGGLASRSGAVLTDDPETLWNAVRGSLLGLELAVEDGDERDALTMLARTRELLDALRGGGRQIDWSGPAYARAQIREAGMSGFELFVPRGGGANKCRPGEAIVAKSGRITFNITDARQVQLNGKAVVLLDRATRRLAIRKPDDEAGFVEPTLETRAIRKGTAVALNLKAALEDLGVDRESVTGKRRAQVNGNLLIVELGGVPDDQAAATPAAAGAARARKRG